MQIKIWFELYKIKKSISVLKKNINRFGNIFVFTNNINNINNSLNLLNIIFRNVNGKVRIKYEKKLFDIFYSFLAYIENHENYNFVCDLFVIESFSNLFNDLARYCDIIDIKYNIRDL